MSWQPMKEGDLSELHALDRSPRIAPEWPKAESMCLIAVKRDGTGFDLRSKLLGNDEQLEKLLDDDALQKSGASLLFFSVTKKAAEMAGYREKQ